MSQIPCFHVLCRSIGLERQATHPKLFPMINDNFFYVALLFEWNIPALADFGLYNLQ